MGCGGSEAVRGSILSRSRTRFCSGVGSGISGAPSLAWRRRRVASVVKIRLAVGFAGAAGVEAVDLGGRGEVAAGLAFDEAEGQQGQAGHADKRCDATVGVQE